MCVIAASVCGALCAVLGEEKFGGYLKFVCALVCICILLTPLASDLPSAENFLRELPQISVSETDEGLLPLVWEMTEDETEKYICALTQNEFGINPADCRIDIDRSGEEAVIKSISVTVLNTDSATKKSIKSFLQKELGGEVTVVGE